MPTSSRLLVNILCFAIFKSVKVYKALLWIQTRARHMRHTHSNHTQPSPYASCAAPETKWSNRVSSQQSVSSSVEWEKSAVLCAERDRLLRHCAVPRWLSSAGSCLALRRRETLCHGPQSCRSSSAFQCYPMWHPRCTDSGMYRVCVHIHLKAKHGVYFFMYAGRK